MTYITQEQYRRDISKRQEENEWSRRLGFGRYRQKKQIMDKEYPYRLATCPRNTTKTGFFCKEYESNSVFIGPVVRMKGWDAVKRNRQMAIKFAKEPSDTVKKLYKWVRVKETENGSA